MRRPLATSLLAVALALPAAAAAQASADPETGATDAKASVRPRSDAWEAKVLKLTNKRRAAHGRKPLKASPCADGFAEPWTRHLARNQVLRHQALDPFFTCPHCRTPGRTSPTATRLPGLW